jgi:hypothetical protein
MPTPSPEIIAVLQFFAPVFTKPTFAHACTLVYGALLAVGARTVASALRAVGLAHGRHFTTYHRVLNRARWSPLALSRSLLALLVDTFLPAAAPLVLLVDETLERRRGPQIAWKSRFRDPLRASPGRPVTTPALRWLNVSLLVPVPWSQRPWALPFLTLPAPAPATSAKLGKRHRTLVDLAGLAIRLVRRWQPARDLTLVGDGTDAALALGHACRRLPGTVRLVSRLRLDAVLHAPPGPRQPGQRGPTPKKGARLPTLAAHLADPTTGWQRVRLPWYGGRTQVMDLVSGTALWYHPGQAPLPLRWVLLRDPAGKEAPTALFSTDHAATPEQIVAGSWAAGTSRSPSRRRAGIWGWRRSGNGPHGRSGARRRACWGCSVWWRCWPIDCMGRPSPPAGRPGIRSARRPSVTPSRRCGGRCGRCRHSRCPRWRQTIRISLPRCGNAYRRRRPMPPKWPKSRRITDYG